MINKQTMWHDDVAKAYSQSLDGQSVYHDITFQVNSTCNLNCSYCYENHKCNEKMSLETGKKLIDMLYDLEDTKFKTIQGRTINFIGGEPFLDAKLIEELIKYYLEEGLRRKSRLVWRTMFPITTNGVNYFDSDVQHLIKRYSTLTPHTVSIDGTKELHDLNRVDKKGNGSFDAAFKAFKSIPKCKRHSKMTFAPESFPYIFESIKFMLTEGVSVLNCNYAYEPEYTYEDAKILYEQLKMTADYLIDTKESTYISILDSWVGLPMSVWKSDDNYCGGNGRMLSFAPDGKIYPCIRYAPISMGEELAKTVCIGDCDNGLCERPEEQAILDQMSCMTRTSQSSEECLNCPVGTGCGWCSAYNYEYYGCFNKRVTHICNAHKARAAAIQYYVSKRSLILKDIIPRENNIPKEMALNFMSEEEFEMLDAISKEAIEAYKSDPSAYKTEELDIVKYNISQN